MSHWCLLLVLLLICLMKDSIMKDSIMKDSIIEGIDDGLGGTHTTATVADMDEDELKDELKRIREENYSDADGFEAMIKKGQCTDEGDGRNHHSCKIEDAKDTKPNIDLRYVKPSSNDLHSGLNFTHVDNCPTKYQDTMKILVGENIKADTELYKMTLDSTIPNPDNFFKNKFSIGQYPGYTQNGYLHRTRYTESDEPLPVNPDFFVDGGGTYA
jgi:hypothetical protein